MFNSIVDTLLKRPVLFAERVLETERAADNMWKA